MEWVYFQWFFCQGQFLHGKIPFAAFFPQKQLDLKSC